MEILFSTILKRVRGRRLRHVGCRRGAREDKRLVRRRRKVLGWCSKLRTLENFWSRVSHRKKPSMFQKSAMSIGVLEISLKGSSIPLLAGLWDERKTRPAALLAPQGL